MELAIENKQYILSAIGEGNLEWSFEDRLLVWLMPTFYSDVRNYYENSGPQMATLFQVHHLKHFDSDFRERLAMRLEVIRSAEKGVRGKAKSSRTILCPHCHKAIPEISQHIAILRLEYEQLWDRVSALDRSGTPANRPSKIVFVASKFRKYFHKPQCEWMRYVVPSSLMTFASRNEAFDAGFKPCRTCRA